MIQPLELLIGLRYTRAKRRTHFISFISLTSMLGITVGVWALITVLSVMNGFERELKERILAVASHVTVTGQDGWLSNWEEVNRSLVADPGVISTAPFVLGQGLVLKRNEVKGVLIRGVDRELETQVSTLPGHMYRGSWSSLTSGSWGIILGSTLSWQLGASIGDKVTVVAPKGQITPAGLLPRLKRFTVVGIFELGMHEYDSGLALLHIDDAAKLLKTTDKVTGIRLKIDDLYHAPATRNSLAKMLGSRYRVSDWTQEHVNFFRALKIERRVMFIILLLIVAVAAFNIVSTLIMVVTDKRADVAILRTLGMSPFRVMMIFIIQGSLIGLAGTLAGGAVGILTAVNVETLVPWLESLFEIEFFPASVYVISDFPAELRWPDVYQITSVSLLLSVLATLYPAWRASRTDPVEVLRFE
ncbi:MAG: lipoprotein-releasing ABC transporter permease subunit [Pseudomonadota bacterium]|nr:lipoprotein-releasing ABC transporter permease subunit [Pseudomonadota bacterium]